MEDAQIFSSRASPSSRVHRARALADERWARSPTDPIDRPALHVDLPRFSLARARARRRGEGGDETSMDGWRAVRGGGMRTGGECARDDA